MKRVEGASDVPRETVRIEELGARYRLSGAQISQLRVLLEVLEESLDAPSSVTLPTEAVDVHIADSLSALELEELRQPDVIADLGSGAGFPALVLAIARPDSRVFAVESTARKCRFIETAAGRLQLSNLEVVWSRAESWSEGAGGCDVVCARALASLPVLCEYAAPLLRLGGVLVAWKGELDPDEAARAARAAARLALSPPVAVSARPYPGSLNRRLYRVEKRGETPPGFPRRPGMAVKRSLG